MNVFSIVELWPAVIMLRSHFRQAEVHVNFCKCMGSIQHTLGSVDGYLRTHLREQFALKFANPVLCVQDQRLVLLEVGGDKAFACRKCLLAHIVGGHATQL